MVGRTYLKKYFNETIYSQVKSEGAGVTFIETQQILEGKYDNDVVFEEKHMIINLKRGWQYIVEKMDDEFHFEDICTLNRILSDLTNPNPGVLRKDTVYIVSKDDKRYYPKPIDEFVAREKYFKINMIKNPVEKAIELFYLFLKINYLQIAIKEQLF